MFLWIGQGATEEENTKGLTFAKNFIQQVRVNFSSHPSAVTLFVFLFDYSLFFLPLSLFFSLFLSPSLYLFFSLSHTVSYSLFTYTHTNTHSLSFPHTFSLPLFKAGDGRDVSCPVITVYGSNEPAMFTAHFLVRYSSNTVRH